MKLKPDLEAVQEDLRRIGVGLLIASTAGGILKQISVVNVIASIALGLAFIIAGVIRKEVQ